MASTGWTNDHGDAREISLCWLAHALLSVARRVRSGSASTAGLPLLCMAARDRKATVLPALVRAIQQKPEDHEETDAPSLSVHSLAAIEALPSSLESVAGEARVVVVCVEAEDDSDTASWRHVLKQLQPRGGNACDPALAWIAVAFSCATPTGLSLRVAVHGSLSFDVVNLETAVQPLHELREQCGLPLALELLAKLAREPPGRDASADASLLAKPVASHLPFQLLAMLLRWSYFHPRVVATLGRPFWRKLALIPQPRVRHEIEMLYTSHARIWQEMHPDSAALHTLPVKAPSSVSTQLRLPLDVGDGETHEDEGTLPPLQRLSQCALWDKQKQFYRDHGIRAWSTHLIPFGVSSSSYLARQYACLAVDFLVRTVATTPPPLRSVSPQQPRTPNCFVWEAASGSCKFLHAFLLHFYALIERDRLEDRLGLVPCVVATDLSEQVLQSRADMACFQRYLQDRRLDFAAFDTDAFLPRETHDDDTRGVLRLRHSGIRWRVGHERGPVFIIGNYFLDSLRSDVFVVTQRPVDGREDGSSRSAVELREARIDPTTESIPDMLFSLATLPDHPRHVPVYDDALANATLVATLDRLQAHWAATETASVAGGGHSSLVLFPVEAIAFLNAVLSDESSFPVAVVTGDATFSFRDAVPSAFIDEYTGDLEIPQLSPHPDCFCLPVDLEILQLAASQQQHSSASVVSSPTSDTFNIFFAQSSLVDTSSQEALARRLHEVFDRFTPSDCDLVWGLLRVDGGATQLSRASQMALLAQTAWDFDVFATVQWRLVHEWKEQIKELELVQGSGQENKRVVAIQRHRQRLVLAGQRSLDTFYVMDESARSEAAAVTWLQVARWFYELRAFAQAKAVLETLDVDHSGVRVAATYLLGLIAYQLHDLWTALTWFRKGQQLEPNRLRLAKWVARTLIRLQETTQQQQSERT